MVIAQVESLQRRVIEIDEPLTTGIRLHVEVPCFRCRRDTRVLYPSGPMHSVCLSCALLDHVLDLLRIARQVEMVTEKLQVEVDPQALNIGVFADEPSIVYVNNNGGSTVVINDVMDFSNMAPVVFTELSPYPEGTRLTWTRDASGKMVEKPLLPTPGREASNEPWERSPYTQQIDFATEELKEAERDLADGNFTLEGGTHSPAGGAFEAGHHIHKTATIEDPSLLGEDASLFEGLAPTTFRLASASDVARYEATYGDPELMQMLEEEDREITEATIKILKKPYTGIVRTSRPKAAALP
jgi:hypothetical protein